MRGLDREQAAAFASRLEKLGEDSVRQWGELEHTELIPHLIGAFQYSMGQLERVETVFQGNWFTTNVLPHIVFTGFVSPPKNIKLRNQAGDELSAILVPGDLSDLKATMDEFITKVESGELCAESHMIFGDIGPKGWSKFHVIHLRHHTKQFGL